MKALLKEFFSNPRVVAITLFAIFYPILVTATFVILNTVFKINVPNGWFYFQIFITFIPPMIAFFYLPIKKKKHLFFTWAFLSAFYLAGQIFVNLMMLFLLPCILKGDGYCQVP